MSRTSARQLQTRAEVTKLARLLGREAAELAYLERLAAADLVRLRHGVTEVLYDADAAALRRLAAAGRLLPTSLVATIAQRAFGPLLSARLAALLDLQRAVELAGKLPPGFLADVAAELDPRRASDLIAAVSPNVVAQITRELALREDYVTMGHFVAHLSDDGILAATGELDDVALREVWLLLDDSEQRRLSSSQGGDPGLEARIARLSGQGV